MYGGLGWVGISSAVSMMCAIIKIASLREKAQQLAVMVLPKVFFISRSANMSIV